MGLITQETYDVLMQSNRELSVRLFLYNQSFKKIGSLEGVCIGGNISISNSSDIRRTANIDLVIKNSSFLVGADKKIWLNRWVKIEVGIKNFKTNNIIWYNQGYFMPNSSTVKYNATDKTLSLECLDPMILLTERRNGELGISTKIPASTPIVEALRSTILLVSSLNNFFIEPTDRTIPSEIQVDGTSTVYSLIKQISDLYLDYEIFYDVDCNFRYQKVKTGISDPVVFNFETFPKKLVIDVENNIDFSNVKNKIIIWGRTDDTTGTQITYTKTNEDSNNKFSIPNLGELKKTIIDDKIQTLDSAQSWADYYMFQHSNMCEKLTINCLPIYFLDCNQKIYFKNKDIEVDGDYLITDLSIPLTVDSLMQISCVKIY